MFFNQFETLLNFVKRKKFLFQFNKNSIKKKKGVELPDPIESSLIFCWIYKFIIPSPSRLKAFIDWGKKYSFQEHQLQAFENLERGLEGN